MAGGTATVACGPEPAPQSPDKVQQDTDQKEAAGPPDAGPVDLQYDPNNQPKPYGAPPARHRIV